MIPWLDIPTYSIGPLVLQTWGTFVAAGFLLGVFIAAKRAHRHGLDSKHVWDMAFWIFLAAMIGARAFHVLFYDPGYYVLHPWDAIDPRKPGFAYLGGILGAAAAFWWYVKKHSLSFLNYADELIWGLVWGSGVGRIGCFLTHLHPGTLTSFVLGVQYPDGVRHDLGLYLSLFSFAIGLVFLAFDRKRRRPGFFLGAFFAIYGIGRFFLDFLRILDRRIFFLTPTQWLLIVFVAIGAWLLKSGTLSSRTKKI